jgi:hypothetical protein
MLMIAEVETVAEAIDRLAARGFVDDFRPSGSGLEARGCGACHPPEELVVEEVVRFEGVSNPDEEAIVFALRCAAHGVRGTYAAAYGPSMDQRDASIAQRLTLVANSAKQRGAAAGAH